MFIISHSSGSLVTEIEWKAKYRLHMTVITVVS